MAQSWSPVQTRTQVNASSNLHVCLVWTLTCGDLILLTLTCGNFVHAQMSLQVEATCYKLVRACDLFEWNKHKLPQVNLCFCLNGA
jgi:hypothetical protein